MKRILKAFLYSFALAFLSLAVVSWFWEQPLLLTLVLAIISLFMLLVRMSREDLLLYAVVGISGALAEMVAIRFGAWDYAAPNVSGVPYWLPFLWGAAGLFVKRISEEIHDFMHNNAVRR